jgi:gliding motility-associated-like protein
MHSSQFCKSFLLFALLFSSFLGWGQTATPASGTGTSDDPYLINNFNNLYWLSIQNSTFWGAGHYFKQTADIDASASSSFTSPLSPGRVNQTATGTNTSRGINPIGDLYKEFTGTYDGNNKTISNLFMNRDDGYLGLFGYVKNGKIKNLKIVGATFYTDIGGASKAGILVGSIYNPDFSSTEYGIENVIIESSTISNTGNIGTQLGGMVGESRDTNIINSHVINVGVSSVMNTSSSAMVGGLIGYSWGWSSVKYCSSSGNVVSDGYRVGGLIGDIHQTTVSESYSTSNVTGASHSGGFYGFGSSSVTISNCFARGNISPYSSSNSLDYYGSFIGNGSYANITSTYGTGFVNNGLGQTAGGYAGVISGVNPNSYFDTGTTGKSAVEALGTGTVPSTLLGKPSTEMILESTFEGFDFDNIWSINSSVNNNYPFLINSVPNPVLKISSSQNSVNNTDPVTITFTITKDVDNFESSDISFTGSGTFSPSTFTAVDSKTYTLLYTAPSDQTGTVTITVANNTFSTTSTFSNSIVLNGYGDSLVLSYDTTSPEVSTFTASDVNLNATETATLGVTLTQSSTTFIASDINLETSGAETGALSVYTAVNSKTYSLLYTPPTNFSGTVTLTIPAGSFDNTESPAKANTQTSTLVLNIDTIAPTISTLSHTHEDAVVRDANTVPFFVIFTEPMASSPKISIGSVVTDQSMTVSPSTNSQTWTYNWDVPAGSDGIVTATVTATDLFGNYYGGSESLNLTIDNVSPTITLTENDADDIVLLGESVIFTTSVNETVSGVPSMTIVTTAGITNDVLTAAGPDWTYSYTAPSNYSGVVSFTVSLLDVAGNISTATKTLTVDSITASITLITSPNSNGKYTDDDANPANSDTLSITLTFNEDVVVSSGTYPYLTLNTLPSQNAFYAGGSGTQTLTFSYRVIDGGEAVDLGVTGVVLPSGVTIKDLAGNPADLSLATLNANSNNLSDTKDIEIRAKDPTFINLTAASNNVMGLFGATDGNTVTYNFTSDIPLLSSSVSMTFGGYSTQPSLTQSNAGNTYSLSFTVLNSMPEGALNLTLFATDTHSSTLVPEENRSANYTQTAFNQTLIIDRTAPIISPTVFSSPENSITGPRILANEVVFNYTLTGGADQAKFTINPTTGVLSFVNAPDFEAPTDADTDNVYDIEVEVTDIVGLTATQTIAVTVTDVSDTFGVDLTALDTQTSEAGDTASVNVKLFTEPTATVRLALQSSDTSEGRLSTSSLEFTTSNWNVDQNVQITGVDDSEIDGDINYLFQVASVVSEDVNYNALVVDGLGLTNIDNEIDTDGDGFFDYQDTFPTDPLEWADTDGDGIGNNADLDDDGDGFSDLIEIECGSNSLDNSKVPLDSDADGTIDCQDTDDDNDGIPDSQDNCPFVANASQADADLDGIGDACDPDDDNDGILDAQDSFPLDPTESIDTDGDGIGNNADLDDDNDGQSDIHENNCFSDPLSSDTMALDSDSDNIPDCIDTDDDGDGVEDTQDAFPLDPSEWTDTDADGTGNNADTDDDNDGFSDVDELSCDSDPFDASIRPSDIDNDGIADCVDTDMDGDGVLNSEDLFPTDPSEWSDNDQDGLGDNFDVDDDNDGILDVDDAFPLDPNESKDTDGDGIGDNADLDDNNDGFGDIDLEVSGALTPNSSGLESTWKIINIEKYPNARVQIYNRNGQEVFSAIAYRNDWRGTYKNSSNPLPAGSYYYMIDLNDTSKEVIKGWLYITY